MLNIACCIQLRKVHLSKNGLLVSFNNLLVVGYRVRKMFLCSSEICVANTTSNFRQGRKTGCQLVNGMSRLSLLNKCTVNIKV